MIDRIFAAPKHLPEESKGIAYAAKQDLGYEIPAFIEAQVLDDFKKDPENYIKRYSSIERWLAVRGPLTNLNPVSNDPTVAQYGFQRYIDTVQAAKALGAKYVIFESGYRRYHDTGGNYAEWLSKTGNFWKKFIAEQLRSTDLMILLSNHMETHPEQLLALINHVDSHKLKLCLDVGQTLVNSKVPAIDWLDRLEHDIEYVRVSNNNGIIDNNQTFEDGILEIKSFINHVVLLPQRLHLGINVNSVEGMEESFSILKPYLKQQQQYMTTKSLII